jgi:hypothetical protein
MEKSTNMPERVKARMYRASDTLGRSPSGELLIMPSNNTDEDVVKALEAEVARLKDECDFMKVCGVIELMARNPNIDSFVKEKEAQIEQLEQDLAYCEDFGRCNCLKNYCDKGLEN